MTVDQALEEVKRSHLRDQQKKAKAAKAKAAKAKAMADKAKAGRRKTTLDPSRILFQAKVLRDSKPTEELDDLLAVKAQEIVNVLDTEDDDAWECEYQGRLGFVRVRHLEKLDGPLRFHGGEGVPVPDSESDALMAQAKRAQEEAQQAQEEAEAALRELNEVKEAVKQLNPMAGVNLDGDSEDEDEDEEDDATEHAEESEGLSEAATEQTSITGPETELAEEPVPETN